MVRVPWTQLLLLLSLQQLTPTLASRLGPRVVVPSDPKIQPPADLAYPGSPNADPDRDLPDPGPPYIDIPPAEVGAQPHPGPIYVVSWTEPNVVARRGLTAGRVRTPWWPRPPPEDSDSDDADYHDQVGYVDAVSAIRAYLRPRTQHLEEPYLYEFRQGQYAGRFGAGDGVRHARLTGLDQPLRLGSNRWNAHNWGVYFGRLDWEEFTDTDAAGPSGHGLEGSTSTRRPQPNPAGEDEHGPQVERPSTSGGGPADQDGHGPQLPRPDVNQENLRQWESGEFGAVKRHHDLRSLGEVKDAGRNDCHQARHMAASHIQAQRPLQNMDFAALGVPDALRPAQASGLMTPAQCARVLTGLIGLWKSKGQWHKQETKEEAPRDQCARLAEEVILVEPSACNLDYIDVDFLLADERWAGTDHMMDLVLHGSFAKSASEPIRLGSDMDRGWRHTQRIDLQKEFNAKSISIKSIKELQLWSGKDQLWVQGLRLRGRCAASKQDMAMEKFANLNKKMSANEWSTIWSGKIKLEDWRSRSCEEIDRLELDIQLKDEAWAGTDDALDLVILGEFIGKTSYSIHMGHDMNRGWRHREKIQMSSLNNGPHTFIGARHITGLELRSASGDQIKLESIKVKAKCAKSSAEALIDRKWESINQWVEADKQNYGKIWYGAIEAKDWSWRPPCYEFDELKVAFHLADASWAGTDGRIEVKFNLNGPRTKLAEDPDRNHRATVNIDLATVFSKKVVSVDEIKVFEIWTGTDEIYVDSLQLLARCAKSGKQAVFDRYKNLNTKMVSSSGFDSVWTGQVYPTGWKAK